MICKKCAHESYCDMTQFGGHVPPITACPQFKKKAPTNADRIRDMTDEELAELFEIIPHLGNPSTYTIDGFCIDDGLKTKRQWLNWLKQENGEI